MFRANCRKIAPGFTPANITFGIFRANNNRRAVSHGAKRSSYRIDDWNPKDLCFD
jgi:hypothetical protein